MKEKLTNNIGLKLLSLLFAFLLWAGVINSQDPVETVAFENVPVQIVNESSLVNKDKIPEIVEGETITVVVEARRSICDKLTADDIVAIADFEKISLTDAVPIEVSVQGYSERDVEIVRGMNKVMKLSLEDSVSKEFRVKIATSGDPATGYVTGDMVASPNVITLTGSSTQINNIKEVVFVADISNVSTERQIYGIPVIYDKDGDIVSNSKVTMSTSSIKVNISVLKTRIVDLNVVTAGEPAAGYELASVSYQPQSVTIAGTAVDLLVLGNKIDVICDISGAHRTIEKNIDITSLWDDELSSLRLVDDEKLAITVTFKEQDEKRLDIEAEDVALLNLPEGLAAQIDSLSVSQIRLRGNQNVLKGIELKDLVPYIDLTSYKTPGTYTVVVNFDSMSGVLLQEVVKAQVTITDAAEEAQDPEAPGNAGTLSE